MIDDPGPTKPVFDNLPERITAPAAAFVEEEARLVDFVAFVRELARRVDATRAIAIAALEDDPAKRAELEAKRDGEGPALREFRKHQDLLRQTVLVRTVDNYLTYVSQMLGELFRHRPEMLRSERQVSLDRILQYKSMDDLVSALAEREVEKLTYLGLEELCAELEKRFGMVLFEREQQRASAVLDVERRNLIVHNRGVINSRWTAKLGRKHGAEGDALDLGGTGTWDALVNLHNAVVATDTRLAAKFGLPADMAPDDVPGARLAQPE